MNTPAIVALRRPLKELNWLKVGGVAEHFAEPRSIEELKEVWRWALENAMPVWVISGGSNILLQDGEIKGLVLSTHGLVGVEEVVKSDDRISIRALAGTPKSEAAKIFLQNKLAPAIFLTGIPGDLGAGVVMNAGIGEQRVPREFCEIVREIEVLRPRSEPLHAHDQILRSDEFFHEICIQGKDLHWQYRHSGGWQPGLITRVTLEWTMAPDANVMNEVRAQTKKRVSTQPLELPNCGSVFRNPPGHKSAQLIEQCGLKGYTVGGAQVSLKHANFIVNRGGATASDVAAVIEHVRQTVRTQKGVELQTEVVPIGTFR
jgi:UDP-N-acetylmuramate dehydrogenase